MLQLLFLSLILISIEQAVSKQFYDPTACFSSEFTPGSRYTCNAARRSCNTFIVFRSRQGFNDASSIAGLFDTKLDQLLSLNNITNQSQMIKYDREVLVPVGCSCSGGFFRSELSYTAHSNTSYAGISCDVFEGLVKLSTLAESNPPDTGNVMKGAQLKIPLKCACPDDNDTRNRFRYLVTYPIQESDEPKLIAERFSIPLGDLLDQNSLGAEPTVFTNTTVLVPLRNLSSINWNVSDIPSDRGHSFIPFTPSEAVGMKASKKNLYVVGSVLGFIIMFAMLSGVVYLFRKGKNRRRGVRLVGSSARSSTPSCLSPDLVAVMSRYSVTSYTVKELSEATEGFNKETLLGSSVHKGRIGDTEFAMKKMGYGDARRTISIHSRINHANIVKLEGVCYGDDEFSSSFLVFEFARHGSLRDCLNNPQQALSWDMRTQIALDVAIGLHYIHDCTVPSYVHMNITSKTVLITEDWRAKIANLGAGSVINSPKEWGYDVAMTSEGWIAPEYAHYGQVSSKVDVFAFGVVLFEILSAKEVKDGSFLMEQLFFLHRGGCVTSCFEELRGFVDPNLKEYPIADVLCMTLLAKGCIDEDPMHRPSMNDILKILARMVQ